MHSLVRLVALGSLLLISTPSLSQDDAIDPLSYSFGLLIATNLKRQGVEGLDAASVAQAVNDVFGDEELAIQPGDANANVQQYFADLQARRTEEATRQEQEFLKQNGAKAGVITTASGLQYEILSQGDGPKPTTADRVNVHYEGKLLDGSVFDSSIARGAPATFGVTQVIAGWVEGLQLMNTGSRFRFYIPHELAYGPQGSPPAIPPYATLIFEVELLGIE